MWLHFAATNIQSDNKLINLQKSGFLLGAKWVKIQTKEEEKEKKISLRRVGPKIKFSIKLRQK